MSDLVRNYPVIFLPLNNNIEQAFGKDDNELKRIYTILNSLRGLYISGTPPTSPNNGDLWRDSSVTPNIVKEWNGSAWVTFLESTTQLTQILNEKLGANISSASTINLTTATGNFLHITGTTTITAVTLGAGMRREVIFDGILTLTHHATNNNLPSGANITTAAGDRASYYSDGTTVYCTNYERASGRALVADTGFALVGGSATQKFKVANATASDEAVALGQFTSGTGWHKLPDGTIEQWGTVNIGSAGTITVTLPIAFTTTFYYATITPIDYNAGTNSYPWSKATSTLTQLVFYAPIGVNVSYKVGGK